MNQVSPMPTAPPFVHLHCHSDYSLLDGAMTVEALVARAKELGMSAVALTDHGNLYGAIDFDRACRQAGLRPILGYEAYVAPVSRFDPDGDPHHLTLLAQNREGFRNLVKLSSYAFRDGLRERSPSDRPIPCIDKELLEAHSAGVVCLSGSPRGELPVALVGADTLARGAEVTTWYRRVFGERYYVELQPGAPVELTQRLVELAKREGIPVVATGNVHYLDPADAPVHAVLNAIRDGRWLNETVPPESAKASLHFRTAEEMATAFPEALEAVARSQEVADSCAVDLELGKRSFPTFTTPGKSEPDIAASEPYLRQLVHSGLKERYAKAPERWRNGDTSTKELSEEVLARVDRELGVIHKLGGADYFLMVWDIVRFARERGIFSTARGAAAGSLVAFALRLSHVCPLKYDLLFERFLDESSLEAPDIDIDLCRERRGEVIQYIRNKYGEANVALLGTFGRIGPAAAIGDVGRAIGMRRSRVDRLKELMPCEVGLTIERALVTSDELKQAYESSPKARACLNLASRIVGFARNVGTHAAAVVISEKPIDDDVPLQWVKGRSGAITQWTLGNVEAAGLLTMDCLGLKSLTILAKSVELIERSTGEKVDPYDFPLDDKPTYALFGRGETAGVLLFESGGIRGVLQRLQPDNFLDLIAVAALYRPGPVEAGMVDQYIEVKHGRRPADDPGSRSHPVMEEVLHETHGVMVYQEQVMRILNRLGRIPLSQAFSCIKAIRSKNLSLVAMFEEDFHKGAHEQGLDKPTAEAIFETIKKFAGHSFNKSHSTVYALIAYQSAYLRTHYPVQFTAAMLADDVKAMFFSARVFAVTLPEARALGVTIELPEDLGSEERYEVTIEPDTTPGCRHAHKIVVKPAPDSPNP